MPSPTLVDPPAPTQCLLYGNSPLENRLTMVPQLFGSNAAWLLLGFIYVQTYTYSKRSRREPLGLNILVYSLVVLLTANKAVNVFVAYGNLVSGRGDALLFVSYGAASVADGLQPLFVALFALPVQLFFTWRIWTFCMAACGCRMKLVAAMACFFIVCTSICALVTAILLCGMFISPVPYPNSLFQKVIFIWTVSTAVADATITAIMIAILCHARSGAYIGETRDRISHLLRLTLQTGFLTSALTLPIAPLYQNSSNIYDITLYVLGESYVLSLLANLNARSYNPTSSDDAGGLDNSSIPHISTVEFITCPPKDRDRDSNGERSAGTGILSTIRSVVYTIHRDLTETATERTSRSFPNCEGEISENDHVNDGDLGEFKAAGYL